MKTGIYSMAAVQIDAITLGAIDWWSSYGSKIVELPEVTKKVLISSSLKKRKYGSYSYVL